MAVGDKQFVLMASQLGTANGPAQLNSDSLLPILQGGTMAGNTQLALANLGAGVRPNLLDNAYFVDGGSQQGGGQFPINQMGQTSYQSSTSTFLYGIDRWAVTGAKMSLNETALSVEFLAEDNVYSRITQLTQKTLYANATYTLSVLAKISVASSNVVLRCCTSAYGSIPGASGVSLTPTSSLELFSITLSVSEDQNNFGVEILDPNKGAGEFSGEIVAIKLEEGANQTLAYQDETGEWRLLPQTDMDYDVQLMKCQKYQVVYPMVQNGLYFTGVAHNTTLCTTIITTPVPLRVNPSVVIDYSSIELFDGSDSSDITSIAFYTQSQNQVTISINSSELILGKSYFIRAKIATQLALSANL